MELTQKGGDFFNRLEKIIPNVLNVRNLAAYKKSIYEISKRYNIDSVYFGDTRIVFLNLDNDRGIISGEGVLKVDTFYDYFYPERHTKNRNIHNKLSGVKQSFSANKNEIINYNYTKNKYNNIFAPVKNYEESSGSWLIMPFIPRTPTQNQLDYFKNRCKKNNLFLPDISIKNCGLQNNRVLCYDYSLPMLDTKSMEPIIIDYNKEWKRLHD
jgi:hypothetical protein